MAFDPNQPRDDHGRWTEGSESPEAAKAQADKTAKDEAPLNGLPQKPIQLGKEWYVPGPNGTLRDVAKQYMEKAGLPYAPSHDYIKVDPERAAKIAQAFEDMKHDPENPEVKKSYDALGREVQAQWDALKATGVKVEWIKPDKDGNMVDPYADNPRRAATDVSMHNHWWGFPTDAGFGSGDEASKKAMAENPLLKETGETIDGRKVVVNDLFRIVHDMFGHFKEGVGFRADGEDNAWRSHAAMFSKEALPAMTAETRGQNSWVNFGPSAEHNKRASAATTVYAPQKIGMLPSWVWDDIQRGK